MLPDEAYTLVREPSNLSGETDCTTANRAAPRSFGCMRYRKATKDLIYKYELGKSLTRPTPYRSLTTASLLNPLRFV